jgi:serine/threonine-protein kinase
MATVHFGRLLGAVGFSKTVAIKRLYPQFAKDPEFVAMFLDEARLAARVRHPNVVSTLDVVATDGEVFLVMEYVQGVPLSRLAFAAEDGGARIPPGIAVAILVGALHGLHAAHEATSERGEPLELVHRDVSPQNILVGVDGVARVLDFGVAKALGRLHTTRDGRVKGKLGYMAPEHVTGHEVTRVTDVFAASVVLWEALTGRRLFGVGDDGEVIYRILSGRIDPPSAHVPGLPASVDEVTLRGLAREPGERYATARQMARALEQCMHLPSSSEVGDYVEQMAGVLLDSRTRELAAIESEGSAAEVGATAHEASEPAQMATTSNAFGPASLRSGWKPTAAVVALVLAGAGLVAATRAAPSRVSDGVTFPAATAPSFSAPLANVAGPSAAAPSTTASTGEVPSASSSAPVPQASAASVARSRSSVAGPAGGPAAARPAARPATQPPATQCDPPYFVDATGYRHYKRECLR